MGSSKTVTVPTANGDVTVRKLALGDYAEVMKAIDQLPSKFGQFIEDNESFNMKDVFPAIPQIVGDSLPEVAKILAIVSDKDEQFFLEQTDAADVLDVVDGVLQVNDLQRIVASVKKIRTRVQPQDHLPKATEAAQPTPPA